MNKFYVRREDSEGSISFYWRGFMSNPFSQSEMFLFDDLCLAKHLRNNCTIIDPKSLYLIFSLDGKLVD